MSDELLPCPFCGGTANLEYNQGNEVWPQKWWCQCMKCGLTLAAQCGTSTWEQRSKSKKAADDKAKGDAIANWNRRAPVASSPANPWCDAEHEIGHVLISSGLYDCMNDLIGGEESQLIARLIALVDPILAKLHSPRKIPCPATGGDDKAIRFAQAIAEISAGFAELYCIEHAQTTEARDACMAIAEAIRDWAPKHAVEKVLAAQADEGKTA